MSEPVGGANDQVSRREIILGLAKDAVAGTGSLEGRFGEMKVRRKSATISTRGTGRGKRGMRYEIRSRFRRAGPVIGSRETKAVALYPNFGL